MADTFQVGDLVRCQGKIRNNSGTLIDPGGVLFRFQDPSGNLTTYTYGTDAQLVRDSTGIYHVDVNADEAGRWLYRYWSTGSGQAAAFSHFDIQQSPLD